MSSDALIRRLSADLAPVRRRSAWRDAAIVIAACMVEIALFRALGLMRPDMGQAIGSAYMQWKLGGLVLLAGVSCAAAIRSFAPTASSRAGLPVAIALAGGLAAAGLFIAPAGAHGDALLERLSPLHGMLCALSILVVSLPVMGILALLMRRGAPTHQERSALACGLAAGACGALVFAFCCPANDPLYVIVWYAAACLGVTAMGRWLLAQRFRL